MPGLIVLFGSGELTPTGRKIHEEAFKLSRQSAPVRVGILETPTGFEVNAMHGWPQRMEQFFNEHLRDWKPEITRISAWRRDGEDSTQSPRLAALIHGQDYLYSGAGSPSYVVRHLRNTRVWRSMVAANRAGTTLCLGSASAVAVGAFALPVYEIYKVGQDLHWLVGLNFFETLGLQLVIVPHWNNREGEDFDTTRCWMGTSRFAALYQMLPESAVVLGIDKIRLWLWIYSREVFAFWARARPM